MRHTSRFLVAAGLLTATFAMGVTTASAVQWGPVSTWYGGDKVASASGRFTNENNTYARNIITLNDEKADGNPVYAKARFLYYGSMDVCFEVGGTCWWEKSNQSTDEYGTANTPVDVTKRSTLEAEGWKARTKTNVCAQMGFPVPDSCSDPDDGKATFDY